MVKIEAFEKRHFMHQAVRVCHTDHTDSIISWIACFLKIIRNCMWAIPLVWCKFKHLTFVILCTRLLEFVTLITLIASLLGLHAHLS